jgi:Rrf2 family protein
MKITALEEYGIRCLLQLARNAESPEPITVRQVADGEGLSLAYAEKLLIMLSRARLTESIRGAHGGYRMTRPPERVTLGEVIRALDGFPAPTALCERFTGNADRCVHANNCGLRAVWSHVSHQVEQFLDRVPLSTLLESEEHVVSKIEMIR